MVRVVGLCGTHAGYAFQKAKYAAAPWASPRQAYGTSVPLGWFTKAKQCGDDGWRAVTNTRWPSSWAGESAADVSSDRFRIKKGGGKK